MAQKSDSRDSDNSWVLTGTEVRGVGPGWGAKGGGRGSQWPPVILRGCLWTRWGRSGIQPPKMTRTKRKGRRKATRMPAQARGEGAVLRSPVPGWVLLLTSGLCPSAADGTEDGAASLGEKQHPEVGVSRGGDGGGGGGSVGMRDPNPCVPRMQRNARIPMPAQNSLHPALQSSAPRGAGRRKSTTLSLERVLRAAQQVSRSSLWAPSCRSSLWAPSSRSSLWALLTALHPSPGPLLEEGSCTSSDDDVEGLRRRQIHQPRAGTPPPAPIPRRVLQDEGNEEGLSANKLLLGALALVAVALLIVTGELGVPGSGWGVQVEVIIAVSFSSLQVVSTTRQTVSREGCEQGWAPRARCQRVVPPQVLRM